MTGVDTTPHERDLFVSYQTDDSLWAEWVAWQLEVAGISVFLDRWDNDSGGASTTGFIDHALQNSGAMVAIWSPNYARPETHSMKEWNSARSRHGYPIIPVLVAPGVDRPQGVGADNLHIDLRELDEPGARAALLAGLLSHRGGGAGGERRGPREGR